MSDEPIASGIMPTEEERRELRVIARLAWNNWPDNETSRREIAIQDAKAIGANDAWDRVVFRIRCELQRLQKTHD